MCISYIRTVRCRYNTVNFSKNIHKTPHSSPVRAKYRVSFEGPKSDILPEFLQSFMQYLTILGRVITALYCMYVYLCAHVCEYIRIGKHANRFICQVKMHISATPSFRTINDRLLYNITVSYRWLPLVWAGGRCNYSDGDWQLTSAPTTQETCWYMYHVFGRI